MANFCTFGRIQFCALLLAAGTIVAILMVLFFFNYPSMARDRILDAVVFKNDSDAMERFQTTKDLKNLRLSFYLYNVTNADEVLKSSAKINLQEIGPFVYAEYKEKQFIDNNQTTGLITFKLKRRYILDESLSVADPKKVLIVWPNVPLLAARGFIDKLPFWERIPINVVINEAIRKTREPAFINDTAQNFLFDGSKRNLFEYLQKFDPLKFLNPWPLKDNKFALLYGKNFTWDPSIDRTMTASAGFGTTQNFTSLNQYIKINGSSQLPFWKSEPSNCNSVRGTDGEFFQPFLERSKQLEIYSLDICRTLTLKYRRDEYIRGINTFKYALHEDALQSGEKNSANKCYCLSSGPECQLDGLIDLSTCNNPNVFASGAHFYAGSTELLSRVSGISPVNSSLHEPSIYIEPNTGIVAKVRVPLQFNVRLQKDGFKNFDFFKEDRPLIIPLVWVVESAELTDDQASLLKRELFLLNSWLVTLVLGTTIISILAIVAGVAFLCLRFRDSRAQHQSPREPTETDPLISPVAPTRSP